MHLPHARFIVATLLVASCASAATKELPPEGGPARPFALAARQDTRLANGLQITLVPYGSTPKVTVTVVIAVGRITEAANQPGLTTLLTSLMKEGTTTRSAEQIAREAADMGGQISAEPGTDESIFSIDVLSEFAPRAAALLADIVQHPRLPESELPRLQSDLIRETAIARSTPGTLADERFRAVLFGAHPYGAPLPTEQQIKSFDIATVREYYAKNFGAARTRVYSAGKFDATLGPAIAHAFESWPAGTKPVFTAPKPSYQRRLEVIDRPGAAQSTVILGLPVVDPTSQDYIALQVMDSLLGGSFGSRITSNIREQKGYTYSPRSQVVPRMHGAYWAEEADVTTAVTGPSMVEIFKEVDRLRAEPPSAEELKGIQSYLAGVFVLRNSSRRGVINQLDFVDRYGFGDQYLRSYVQRIMAVKPSDVQAMTEKYISPSKMTMVVVGDKAKIESQLTTYQTAQ